MVSNTKEVALQRRFQRHLTGLTTEELAGQPAPEGHGPFRPARRLRHRIRAQTLGLSGSFWKPPKARSWPS